MGRKKEPLATGGKTRGRAAPREITVIQVLGVYHRLDACRALGLGEASITEEVRAGRLRVAVVPDGSWLILGEWLLAWVRDRAAPAAVAGGAGGAEDGRGDAA